jgi:hypothetical protein
MGGAENHAASDLAGAVLPGGGLYTAGFVPVHLVLGSDGERGSVYQVVSQNLAFTGGLVPYHLSVYVLYGYMLLLVVVASLYMINRFQTRKTLLQNIYQVMFYMFVAGLLFYVFVARFDSSSLVFVALPVSYVLSNFFHRKRNPWTHEVTLWILVWLVVYVQIMA